MMDIDDSRELEEILKDCPENLRPKIKAIWEQTRQINSFYQEYGIVAKLDGDEEQLLVFWSKTDEISYKDFAQSLEVWRNKIPNVKRILGIEQMFMGKPPQTASILFMIPINTSNSDSWLEKVGLVTIKKGLGPSEAQNIYKSFTDNFSSLAHIETYHQYCYICR